MCSLALVLALGLAGLTAALLDMLSTAYILDRGGRELNPLARPFTRLPRWAYYATGILGVMLLALIGWCLRTHWYGSIPQVAQIAGNSWGYLHNRRVSRNLA